MRMRMKVGSAVAAVRCMTTAVDRITDAAASCEPDLLFKSGKSGTSDSSPLVKRGERDAGGMNSRTSKVGNWSHNSGKIGDVAPPFVSMDFYVDGLCASLSMGEGWEGRVGKLVKRLQFKMKPSHVVKVLERQKDVKLAFSFFRLAQSYGDSGLWEEAVESLSAMSSIRCKPNTTAYNGLMNALVRAGHIDEASKVYERTLDSGCRPDSYTLGILTRGLCRTGKVDEAVVLMKSMKAEFSPSFNVYNMLLDGLGRAGKVEEASEMFQEMIAQKGLSPDVISYQFAGLAFHIFEHFVAIF
ncbi:hypothetical protein R1sor_000009 [Riccia sorocarpa]|uniref:Pentatricopeptide repeat-containing protein n=1 Tax=Riccia sorocarpa TaxID=122646 RepID=A0ABD3GU77_9MARC